jgi:excisionase family DNA binding protein
MTPELRALRALDELRDALGEIFARSTAPQRPAALVTLTEAALRLGVSRSTVTRWADSGRLRTIGGPNARRVPSAVIAAFIEDPPEAAQ